MQSGEERFSGAWLGDQCFVLEAELLGRALSGVEPPEIDRQMSRPGHNRYFALCASRAGAFSQDNQPFS